MADEHSTVFVVGAGASAEVNMPLGSELKTKIAQLLDIRFDNSRHVSGDAKIVQALRLFMQSKGERDINPYLHACRRIAGAMPQAISIDNFLDAHVDDEKVVMCGKLAIVRAILESERRCNLYFERSRTHRFDFGRLETTWLNQFFQLLTENCRIDDLPQRLGKVTLIVFNYDRVVEHFLYHALQNYFGIDAGRAGELVFGMRILHPYGVVGKLPWAGGDPIVAFGDNTQHDQLLENAQQIRTFTEGADPESSDIETIRGAMQTANRLVFLGFAYHKLNIELICAPSKSEVPPADCYGTAFMISSSDCEVIESELRRLSGNGFARVSLRDLSCAGLFAEFRRSLSWA